MKKCLVDFSTVGIHEMLSSSHKDREGYRHCQSEWGIVGTSPNNMTVLLTTSILGNTLLQRQRVTSSCEGRRDDVIVADEEEDMPTPDAVLVFVSNTYPQGRCTFVALSMGMRAVSLKHSDVNSVLTTSKEHFTSPNNSTSTSTCCLQMTPGTRPHTAPTRTCPIQDAFEEALSIFCETMTSTATATRLTHERKNTTIPKVKSVTSPPLDPGQHHSRTCVQCGKPAVVPTTSSSLKGNGGFEVNAGNKVVRRGHRNRGVSRSTINWDVVQNALRLLHTHLGDPELLCHPDDKPKPTATPTPTDIRSPTRRTSSPPQSTSAAAIGAPSELEPERRRSPSCGSAFDPITNRIIVSVGVPLGDMGALLRKSLGLPPPSSNSRSITPNINHEKYLVTWFSYPPSYTLPLHSAVNTVVVGDRVNSFTEVGGNGKNSSTQKDGTGTSSFGAGDGADEIEYGFKNEDTNDNDADLLLLEREIMDGVVSPRHHGRIGSSSTSPLPYPVVVATYVAARCDININKINHVLHSDRYRNQPPSTEHFESQMSGDDRVKDRAAKKPTDQFGCQKVFGALPWLLSNRLNIASRKNYKMKQLADTKDRLELEISELRELHRRLCNNNALAYASSSSSYSSTTYPSLAARKTQLDSTAGKIEVLKLQLAEVDASLSRIQASFSLPESEARLFSFHNPIVGLQQAVSRRLVSVTSRCVICDSRMGFAALRISACDRESCRYSFENLGIGVDVIHELTSNPVVCELLISLALASVRTGIALGRDTFDPMCTIRISQEDAEDYCRVEERNFLEAFATSWVVNDELKRRYKEAQSRLTQLSSRVDNRRAELTALEIRLGSSVHPLIEEKRHKLAVLTRRVDIYREALSKRFRLCLVGQGGPLDSSTVAHMSEVIEYHWGGNATTTTTVNSGGDELELSDPNSATNIDRLFPSGLFSSPWQVPPNRTVKRTIAEKQKAMKPTNIPLPIHDKFSLTRFQRTILCGRISKNSIQLYTMMDSVFGVRRGSISHGIQHLLTVDEVADLKLVDLLRPLEAGLYGDDRDSVTVSRLHDLHTVHSDVPMRKKAYIQAQLSQTMRVFMTGSAAPSTAGGNKSKATSNHGHKRRSLYDNSYNTIKKDVPFRQEDLHRPFSPNFTDGVATTVNSPDFLSEEASRTSSAIGGGVAATSRDVDIEALERGEYLDPKAVGRTESPNAIQRRLGASHGRYMLSKLLQIQTQLQIHQSQCVLKPTTATPINKALRRCLKALRIINDQIRNCAVGLGIPAIEIEMLVSNNDIRAVSTATKVIDDGDGLKSSPPSQGDFWGEAAYRPTQVISPVTSNSGIGGFPVSLSHATATGSGFTSRHLTPTVSALLQPDVFPLQTVVHISRTQSKHGHEIPKALHQQLVRSEWTTTPPSMVYQFLYTGAEHFFGDVYNGSIKSLRLLETTIENIPPISQMLEKAYDTSRDKEILHEWQKRGAGVGNGDYDDETTSCSSSCSSSDDGASAHQYPQRLYNNDDHYNNSYGTPSGSFSAPPPMMAGDTKRERRGTMAANSTPPISFQRPKEEIIEEEIHLFSPPLPSSASFPPPPMMCASCQQTNTTTNRRSRVSPRTQSAEIEALIQTIQLEDGGDTITLLDPASNEDDIFINDANLKFTGRVRADLNPLWVEKLSSNRRGVSSAKNVETLYSNEFGLRGVGHEEVAASAAVRTPSMSTASKARNPWKPNEQRPLEKNSDASFQKRKKQTRNNSAPQLQVTALARLRRFLGEKDPLLYPLLQWIIASNRVHIEPLPYHLKLEALNDLSNGGCFQFYIVADNPEKEMKFQQHKRRARERLEAEIGAAKVQALLAKNASRASSRNASDIPQTDEDRTKSPTGSFFAWHASSPGNWHSILRHGLKNFSGTHMMSTGQVFGAGIYTATTLPVCMSYAGATQNFWSGTTRLVGTGMSCLSLVEVASASHGWKEMAPHILTIQDEELLCTRFLFVFPTGINAESVAAALHVKFPANFLHRFSEEHCAVF